MYENAKVDPYTRPTLGLSVPAAPRPPSQVGSALDRLDTETSITGELFAQLVGRLSPVLRSESKAETANGKPIYGVEVAERIGQQANRAETLNDALRDVLSRLEV